MPTIGSLCCPLRLLSSSSSVAAARTCHAYRAEPAVRALIRDADQRGGAHGLEEDSIVASRGDASWIRPLWMAPKTSSRPHVVSARTHAIARRNERTQRTHATRKHAPLPLHTYDVGPPQALFRCITIIKPLVCCARLVVDGSGGYGVGCSGWRGHRSFSTSHGEGMTMRALCPRGHGRDRCVAIYVV